MTAERFQEIERQGGWVNLSGRAKWQLTGGDRIRYLNGQVTQDVRKASQEAAVYACVTDVKGRICGDVFVRVSDGGEALWVDSEAHLAEELGIRLERYIIADDVELAEITDEWGLWHAFGMASEGISGVRAERFGVPGVDVWLPSGETPSFSGVELTADEVETIRIVRGVPRHPNELNLRTFPPEAGLEARAMDFSKGCYIGQEVLSRIRTTGKMPRCLVRWALSEATVAVTVGAEIATVEKAMVGEVTSVTRDPVSGLQVGLGYVKQGARLDSELLVGGGMASIRAASQFS